MEWPDTLGTRVIVLDFDKTITKKHTRGAIFQTSAVRPRHDSCPLAAAVAGLRCHLPTTPAAAAVHDTVGHGHSLARTLANPGSVPDAAG